MFEMKQYDTLGSVDSNSRLIQRQFWNWKWNRFWNWNRFNDSLVSNVEQIQTVLELEAESIWNWNRFKDSIVSCAGQIQRHFLNWNWNLFGIGIGLKTAWFHVGDRFKDSFGIGSGYDLELEQV